MGKPLISTRNIMTRWAKDVSPENAWQEYPRPQMSRSEWLSLNGLWDYWITDKAETQTRKQEGEILVPFPIESALSGVKRALEPDELLWYRRTFSVPKSWRGKRLLLHFEAVDWETQVLVNGQQAGMHRGGYVPFELDITGFVDGDGAQNELLVCVWDPSDSHWQQHGKQVLKPKSIWYTAVSGIWQTVWLEPVPQTYISGLMITPDFDTGTLRVKASLVGPSVGACPVHLGVFDGGNCVAQGDAADAGVEIAAQIPEAKPWSPDSPHLYDLRVSAGNDQVDSYFGMRKFSLQDGRLCLNNTPLFQLGPLDQGYWPDGLYTPPSDEAMRWDIELVKRLGFNMLRKHVKVEPRRYYYYCDQLGLIVWQDMPNGGKAVSEMTSTLAIVFGSRRNDRDYRYAGREQAASREDYRSELQELVDHLYNQVSIGMWVPFNEGWGQFDAADTARWLKRLDPTRPVDHASGWFDQGAGDCKSLHVYKLKLPVHRVKGERAVVLSEFGGYSLKVDGHLWNPAVEFGYKNYSHPQALTEAYLDLLNKQLKPWKDAGLSAAVYTQTTDVETEVNGFVTYDREVEKMDFRKLRAEHAALLK
jgi:beta-galactosidase/beta-glucuronidase